MTLAIDIDLAETEGLLGSREVTIDSQSLAALEADLRDHNLDFATLTQVSRHQIRILWRGYGPITAFDLYTIADLTDIHLAPLKDPRDEHIAILEV